MTVKLVPPDPAELSALYEAQQQSIFDLARHFQVSRRTVNKWLRDAHVSLRSQGRTLARQKAKYARPVKVIPCLPGQRHHWHIDSPDGEYSRSVCQICGHVEMMSNISTHQRDGRITHPFIHLA